MRETRPSGSVRGVRRNPYPYRDTPPPAAKQRQTLIPTWQLTFERGLGTTRTCGRPMSDGSCFSSDSYRAILDSRFTRYQRFLSVFLGSRNPCEDYLKESDNAPQKTQ